MSPVSGPEDGSGAGTGDAHPPAAGRGMGFVVAACILFIALAGAAVWDVADMPPPRFGPVGSGDVPWVVGWLTVALSLLVLARAVTLRIATAERTGLPEAVPFPSEAARAPSPGRTLAVLTLTFVYALAVTWGRIDFGLLSTLYLWATIGYLARPRGTALIALGIAAPALAFGCDALFTRVLFIDLP